MIEQEYARLKARMPQRRNFYVGYLALIAACLDAGGVIDPRPREHLWP